MCWQYILKEGVLRPEFVVRDRLDELPHPSRASRAHGDRRHVQGDVVPRVDAAARATTRIAKMARAVRAVEELAPRLADDAFLGKGTIAPTYAEVKTPSVCAVPDHAYLHLDRRVTTGETADSRRSPRCATRSRAQGVAGDGRAPPLRTPSYTGLRYPVDKYFPTWCLAENDPLIGTAVETYETLFSPRARGDALDLLDERRRHHGDERRALLRIRPRRRRGRAHRQRPLPHRAPLDQRRVLRLPSDRLAREAVIPGRRR